MTFQRTNKWTEWRRAIKTKCNHLVQTHGGPGVVVQLRDIAHTCGIRRVQFRPMLVEGGLAIDGNGFLMYVNCPKAEADQRHHDFVENGGLNLPPRTRFTIAHELIHTFFFNLSDSEPQNQIKATHAKEHESLEQACDYGANLMLLPEFRLQSQLKNATELTPETVTRIASDFKVSIETLLIRLNNYEMWGNHRGFAALVVENNDSLKVEAAASDISSKSFFSHIVRNDALEKHMRVSALEIFGGTQKAVPYDLPCRVGGYKAIQPCVVMCNVVARRPKRFVFMVKLNGELRVTKTNALIDEPNRSLPGFHKPGSW